ncbi:hypothetical protein BSL82_15730 [Tardibacter chloracetimidivorans]|uniref:Uncharacterized protein n=1 Tax=Tardibacter chloracetimidivorans TaxID=1921510 RepID=A0A1L3ZY62_9SPHN|nr:hypothetical protein [Tardibacter chloracetimidivorans]API60555.1 hypothetical protein BSL82_15730 [Tardibacter chloracetimidivorans]
MQASDALVLIGMFAVAYVACVAIDRVTDRLTDRRLKAAQDKLRKARMKPRPRSPSIAGTWCACRVMCI